MKILDIREDDPTEGNVTLDVEMTDEEMSVLIEKGFNTMLKEQLERIKNENNICSSVSRT